MIITVCKYPWIAFNTGFFSMWCIRIHYIKPSKIPSFFDFHDDLIYKVKQAHNCMNAMKKNISKEQITIHCSDLKAIASQIKTNCNAIDKQSKTMFL